MMFNLLSIGQLCDTGYRVGFNSFQCLIKYSELNTIIPIGYRKKNIYQVDLHSATNLFVKCFMSREEKT